ncbi:hypothetical protein GGS24DRAFT_37786 [Hypoxylon argillaceum]|nr:hypothetical protein GGS24DRAFT_37786 [Hypoxylon argillaceum]KAI1150828.1 hypothetical protein F4825DRAFT_387515 [Nemania diffusa]
MSSHYPLNGVELDFRRYAHRAFEGRDVFISRIMEDLFNPRRIAPRTYLKAIYPPRGFGSVKSQDRRLGLDMQVMWRLLEMEWSDRMTLTLQQAIIQLAQVHYFERDPLVHQAMKCFSIRNHDPKTAPGWRHDMIIHLLYFKVVSQARDLFSLFSGNSLLPCTEGPWNGRLSLGSCFVAVPWAEQGPKWPRPLQREARHSGYLTMPGASALHHRVPKRSQSVPVEGSWDTATSSSKHDSQHPDNIPYVAFFPRKSLSELIKRSRRRSLSRSHIRAMFKDKPEWIIEDTISHDPRIRPKHACSNCAQYTHITEDCLSRCGYCNSGEHSARNCTLKPENRCKCRSFPQFHRSSQCHVHCSRRCYSIHPPGTYKHMNAMLCSQRCCMCGMLGHSGRKCSFKRCPCGEQHLTQDCRWKVECVVKGCYFYLCPLHCKECGKQREKGSENAFVGRTCPACLKNGIPVSPKAS